MPLTACPAQYPSAIHERQNPPRRRERHRQDGTVQLPRPRHSRSRITSPCRPPMGLGQRTGHCGTARSIPGIEREIWLSWISRVRWIIAWYISSSWITRRPRCWFSIRRRKILLRGCAIGTTISRKRRGNHSPSCWLRHASPEDSCSHGHAREEVHARALVRNTAHETAQRPEAAVTALARPSYGPSIGRASRRRPRPRFLPDETGNPESARQRTCPDSPSGTETADGDESLRGEPSFKLAELETVVSLLAGPGMIQRLEIGGFILLRPEVLSRYAAAAVRKVRKHPQELGCIRENEFLAGDFDSGFRTPATPETMRWWCCARCWKRSLAGRDV